jgi:Cupredoxin-like domain
VRAFRSTSAMVAVGVAVAITLAGCGSGDDSSGSSSATRSTSAPAASTGPSAPSAAGTSIDVTIAGGEVTPDPSRRVEVKTGDRIHLTVTSDTADEIHVHGYDIEKEVSAGGTITIDFTADIPGQFEVEAHELSPALLFTLVVK